MNYFTWLIFFSSIYSSEIGAIIGPDASLISLQEKYTKLSWKGIMDTLSIKKNDE